MNTNFNEKKTVWLKIKGIFGLVLTFILLFGVIGVAFFLIKPSNADDTNDFDKNTLYIGSNGNLWSGFDDTGIAKVSLENADWGLINFISQIGAARLFWEVGEEKNITFTTGEQITVEVIGFDHDDKTDGGKAGITFSAKYITGAFFEVMNDSIFDGQDWTASNIGGWENSKMRTETLELWFARMPIDLKSQIKMVNKVTTIGNISTDTQISQDKLFLFSGQEIYSQTVAGYKDEGTTYEYWRTVKNGTVEADRVKHKVSETGMPVRWWLRSPSVFNNINFLSINTLGVHEGYVADFYSYIFFGFCI
jgi:hypothetical protein